MTDAEYKKTPAPLRDFIKKNNDKQFVLLGDTDHDNAIISNAVLNPDFLKTIRENGFIVLMLEIPLHMQLSMDALKSSDITKQQFIDIAKAGLKISNNGDIDQMFSQWADTVIAARGIGIDILAVDGMEGDYNAILNMNRMGRVAKKLIEMSQNNPEFVVTKNLIHETTEDIQKEMKEDGSYDRLKYNASKEGRNSPYVKHEGFRGRMELDSIILGQRIFGMAEGRPTVVFYGSWHYAKVNDVDETLKKLTDTAPPSQSRRGVVVANLYEHNNDSGVNNTIDFCERFNCSSQPNHTNIYLATGLTDNWNKGYQPKPTLGP